MVWCRSIVPESFVELIEACDEVGYLVDALA